MRNRNSNAHRVRRVAVAIAAAAVLGVVGHEDYKTARLERELRDRTSDGRFHTCGVVTEDGVTEYLDVYAARCNPNQER